jgi:hypothetical protein
MVMFFGILAQRRVGDASHSCAYNDQGSSETYDLLGEASWISVGKAGISKPLWYNRVAEDVHPAHSVHTAFA